MQVCSASQPLSSIKSYETKADRRTESSRALHNRSRYKRRDNCYIDTVIPKKNLYANSFYICINLCAKEAHSFPTLNTFYYV